MTTTTMALVDIEDRLIGTAEKLDAHRRGLLHRAFSVFVFDGQGRLLLQKRAAAKYHSGGLWANSCCGHPGPDEEVAASARRRLNEEMGVDCALTPLFRTIYRADVGAGLTEHEFVHAFYGRASGEPKPDPQEAAEWTWAHLAWIRNDLVGAPTRYAAWFQRYVDEFGSDIAGAASQTTRAGGS